MAENKDTEELSLKECVDQVIDLIINYNENFFFHWIFGLFSK